MGLGGGAYPSQPTRGLRERCESPFLDGSRGSRVTASDPLTHDDEITAVACNFFVLG